MSFQAKYLILHSCDNSAEWSPNCALSLTSGYKLTPPVQVSGIPQNYKQQIRVAEKKPKSKSGVSEQFGKAVCCIVILNLKGRGLERVIVSGWSFSWVILSVNYESYCCI